MGGSEGRCVVVRRSVERGVGNCGKKSVAVPHASTHTSPHLHLPPHTPTHFPKPPTTIPSPLPHPNNTLHHTSLHISLHLPHTPIHFSTPPLTLPSHLSTRSLPHSSVKIVLCLQNSYIYGYCVAVLNYRELWLQGT